MTERGRPQDIQHKPSYFVFMCSSVDEAERMRGGETTNANNLIAYLAAAMDIPGSRIIIHTTNTTLYKTDRKHIQNTLTTTTTIPYYLLYSHSWLLYNCWLLRETNKIVL